MSIKFTIKVKGFREGIEPAILVATKGIDPDHENAALLTLVSDDKGITALADGGHAAISTELLADLNDIGYVPGNSGTCTVKANDLSMTLQSFDANDSLLIEERNTSGGSGRELVFTSLADPDRETYQTLPLLGRDIESSKIIKKFSESKKIKIRRDILVQSAKRLEFAHGWQNFRREFLHWMIELTNEQVRFIAGDGGVFAILDQSGSNLIETKNPDSLLVPNHATKPLNAALATQKDEFASFYPDDRYLTVKCGQVHMIIYDLEPNVKWPNVDKILNRTSSIKVTTKAENWANAVKGLMATLSNFEELKPKGEYHLTAMTLNSKKPNIALSTDGLMKANRKVPIEGSDYGGNGEVTLLVSTPNLDQAFKEASSSEYIQVEVDPTSNSAPVIFRYHAKQTVGDPTMFAKVSDGSGISERYTVFFAQIPPKKSQPKSATPVQVKTHLQTQGN